MGFSKEDREKNVKRVAFVASEIVKHNGIVICSTISPYRSLRNECRSMFDPSAFVEVFVDTALEICEVRDVKGLYQKARKGEIKNLTGIGDSYEIPINPEIKVKGFGKSTEDSSLEVFSYIANNGYIKINSNI